MPYVILIMFVALGWWLLPPVYDTRVLRRRPVLGGRELLHALRERR
jgi:hypothetical protein